MAGLTYAAAVLVVFAAIFAAAACDVVFYVFGELTISDWLRREPVRFYLPAGLLLLFLGGLFVHLFVLPWFLGGKS
jgi:hypothetical protein